MHPFSRLLLAKVTGLCEGLRPLSASNLIWTLVVVQIGGELSERMNISSPRRKWEWPSIACVTIPSSLHFPLAKSHKLYPEVVLVGVQTVNLTLLSVRSGTSKYRVKVSADTSRIP